MSETIKIQLKIALMALIMLLWFAPLIQQVYPIIELKKLEGAVAYSSDDTISWKKWFDGSYTQKKEDYIKEAFGFRNLFVRVKNQFYVSVLKVPTAKDIVIGKDGMLFEEQYIKSYMGGDFTGQDVIRMNLKKLKFISDTLKKLNVDVILLFAPGKATYYPEYIPDRYFKNCDTVNTNYKWAVKIAKEEGLNFIDYNSLFKSLKTTTKYPLYPKTGIHWSVYGSIFAFDSLTRYIENIKHKKLRHFKYDKVTLSNELQGQDEDMGLALNTLVEPDRFKLAYPKLEYTDTADKYRPGVITISDSYWVNMYTFQLPKNTFKNPGFWYYYTTNWNFGIDEVDPLTYNLKNKLESNDVILIMFTEYQVADMGFGFIDDAYNLYSKGDLICKNRERDIKILRLKRWMRTQEKMIFEIEEKAKQLHISFDEMLDIEAYKLSWKERDKKKTEATTEKNEIITCIKKFIRNNSAWMRIITKRAEIENVPVSELVFNDAISIFDERSFFYIKAANGKFVCADAVKNHEITANRDEGHEWEVFSFLKLTDNRCILYSIHQKFLSTESNPKTEITATKNKFDAGDIFTIVACENGLIALKAANGKYVSLNKKNLKLYAVSDTISENEKFLLVGVK